MNHPIWPRLPKHVRAWTREELRLMREWAAAGSSAVVIAERLWRSANAVRRKAQAHGITFQEGRKFQRAWV